VSGKLASFKTFLKNLCLYKGLIHTDLSVSGKLASLAVIQ